jgi:hypothetical protein
LQASKSSEVERHKNYATVNWNANAVVVVVLSIVRLLEEHVASK